MSDWVYPHRSPIILTDDLYVEYGGDDDKGLESQRNGAFLLGEMAVSKHLSAFLMPTVVTGTYPWPLMNAPVQLRWCHIQSVNSVIVRTHTGECNCDLTDNTGCAFVRDGSYGLIYVKQTAGSYCGCRGNPYPFEVQVVYDSGLPTGVATQPNVLLALSTMADIFLNEIVDPSSNEGVGDIGIQQWAAQGYSEQRFDLRRTTLGTSARANFAASLLDNTLPTRRAIKLGY